MQVVQGVDEVHTDMGNLLILLHSHGIRVLQGITRESIYTRHCGTTCFPPRHCFPLLSCLPRQSDLPNGLQAHPNSPQVTLNVELMCRFGGVLVVLLFMISSNMFCFCVFQVLEIHFCD